MQPGIIGRALVFVAVASASVAARQDTPGWRALVMDGGREQLLVLDAASDKPLPVGGAVPGYVFQTRDRSRVVIFGRRNESTIATIVSDSGTTPPQVVGPVSLNRGCAVPMAEGHYLEAKQLREMFESPDGSTLTLSCGGMLARLDLHTGEVITSVVPSSASIHRLPSPDGERILAVATSGEPQSELSLHEAQTLNQTWRVRVNASLFDPLLVNGGREIVLIETDNRYTKKPGPTKLRYLDAATGATLRVIPLDTALRRNRVSTDGQFFYLTNAGEESLPKNVGRQLQIVNAATGEVQLRKVLLDDARWFDLSGEPPPILVNWKFRKAEASHLLFLQAGGIAQTLTIHDDLRSMRIDEARGRLHVLDGRTLAEFEWPSLKPLRAVPLKKGMPWDNTPSTWFAPDWRRALLVKDGSVAVADFDTGTVSSYAKLGSSAARSKKFWSEFGAAMLVGALTGGTASGSMYSITFPQRSFDVAYSEDSRTALVPAPTGEISTIDLATGRIGRHLPGGEGMIAAGRSLAIVVDKMEWRAVNVASGETVTRAPAAKADAEAPLFASLSPDRRVLLVARGSTLHLLDAVTGATLSHWSGFDRLGGVRFLRRER